MAYTLDFRKQAISLMEQNKPIREVSQLLCVGVATLYRWKQRHDQGRLRAHYPSKRGFYKIDEQALRTYLAKRPDAYQHEIAVELGVTRTGVQWALKRLGITRKKAPHSTASAMKTSSL